MASKKLEQNATGKRMVLGGLLILLAVFGVPSMLSFDPGDIPVNQNPPNADPNNAIGLFGAWMVYSGLMVFGLAAYLLPLLFAAVGVLCFAQTRFPDKRLRSKIYWLLVLFFCVLCALALIAPIDMMQDLLAQLNIPFAGGMTGWLIGEQALLPLLGKVGMVILLAVSGIVTAVFLFELGVADFLRNPGAYIRPLLDRLRQQDDGEFHEEPELPLETEKPVKRSKRSKRKKEAESEIPQTEKLSSVQATEQQIPFPPEPDPSVDLAIKEALEQGAIPDSSHEEDAFFKTEVIEPVNMDALDSFMAAQNEADQLSQSESDAPAITLPSPPADIEPVIEPEPVPEIEPVSADEESIFVGGDTEKIAPVTPPAPPAPAPAPSRAARKSVAKKASPEPEVELVAAGGSSSSDGVAWRLPPVSLLEEVKSAAASDGTRETMLQQLLEKTLQEFGVDAKITNVQRGPVVTSYEVLPAPGVRVEKIANLANNLALALKAESIRVQAPIPGKGVVGIEVPNGNGKSSVVYAREIIESDAWAKRKDWRNGKIALPLCIGVDVTGKHLVGDLADMPHLLIAGATGSGKSVCMNSLLAGLLMSRTPEQLRLILVDPKIVEFTAYQDLPHLVVPVITDNKKVGLGLRWAISEMEKRYKMFAKVGVRNIKSFNTRSKAKQGDLFGEEDNGEEKIPDTLPYIVIVIDELADLMMVAQAEVENYIARLAQLSRAVGIHMILATQRPSVNVITGTIKANFPARIAFQVAQKVDSRTILDAIGADKLLGKGDMLHLPPGSAKLMRAQGAWTSDEEINSIVAFIKEQGRPEYESQVKEKLESSAADLPEQDEDDELVEQAVEVIRQTRRASTSSLQRRLRIGYNRAARLMDTLEAKGIIGPPQGSDPREILIDLDGDIPQNEADTPPAAPES